MPNISSYSGWNQGNEAFSEIGCPKRAMGYEEESFKR